MGYYYHSAGWTVQIGKVSPEGQSQPAYFISNGGAVCRTNIGPHDVTKDITDIVTPKYEATKNLKVPFSSALMDQKNDSVASEFFGSMYTSTVSAPPVNRKVALGAWRLKPKSKYRDFQEAKAAGKIVLRPLDDFAASAIIVPGIQEIYVKSPYRVWYARYQVAALERGYSVPCKLAGYVFPSQPSLLYTGQAQARNVWSVLDRYWVPDGGNPWWTPSDAEVWDLSYLLREAFEDVDYAGLVTSTLAEANNKNLDVLTMLGELPETARFVFGVLKTVLSLVRDFRKEAAAIKKRYYQAQARFTRKGEGYAAPGELMDDLSSLWLQYRYALMPLIYSVEDALGVLLKGEVEYRTTRQKKQREILLSHPDWSVSPFVVTDRCFVKHRFEYNPDNYSSNSNFLTANPVLTLWELTTLSHVVDWVFNIGDLLASFDTPPGVTQEACQVSSQTRSTVVFRHKRNLGAEVIFTFDRYKSKPIQPMLHIGFRAGFSGSWQKFLDSVALSWAITKRSFQR